MLLLINQETHQLVVGEHRELVVGADGVDRVAVDVQRPDHRVGLIRAGLHVLGHLQRIVGVGVLAAHLLHEVVEAGLGAEVVGQLAQGVDQLLLGGLGGLDEPTAAAAGGRGRDRRRSGHRRRRRGRLGLVGGGGHGGGGRLDGGTDHLRLAGGQRLGSGQFGPGLARGGLGRLGGLGGYDCFAHSRVLSVGWYKGKSGGPRARWGPAPNGVEGLGRGLRRLPSFDQGQGADRIEPARQHAPALLRRLQVTGRGTLEDRLAHPMGIGFLAQLELARQQQGGDAGHQRRGEAGAATRRATAAGHGADDSLAGGDHPLHLHRLAPVAEVQRPAGGVHRPHRQGRGDGGRHVQALAAIVAHRRDQQRVALGAAAHRFHQVGVGAAVVAELAAADVDHVGLVVQRGVDRPRQVALGARRLVGRVDGHQQTGAAGGDAGRFAAVATEDHAGHVGTVIGGAVGGARPGQPLQSGALEAGVTRVHRPVEHRHADGGVAGGQGPEPFQPRQQSFVTHGGFLLAMARTGTRGAGGRTGARRGHGTEGKQQGIHGADQGPALKERKGGGVGGTAEVPNI